MTVDYVGDRSTSTAMGFPTSSGAPCKLRSPICSSGLVVISGLPLMFWVFMFVTVLIAAALLGIKTALTVIPSARSFAIGHPGHDRCRS